jgi:hypothetical protein
MIRPVVDIMAVDSFPLPFCCVAPGNKWVLSILSKELRLYFWSLHQLPLLEIARTYANEMN